MSVRRVQSLEPFTALRPPGIKDDREVVSQLLRTSSLPGTWNAAFTNGVMVRRHGAEAHAVDARATY